MLNQGQGLFGKNHNHDTWNGPHKLAEPKVLQVSHGAATGPTERVTAQAPGAQE